MQQIILNGRELSKKMEGELKEKVAILKEKSVAYYLRYGSNVSISSFKTGTTIELPD